MPKNKPTNKIRLIHWKLPEAQAKIRLLQDAGFAVICNELSQAEIKKLFSATPESYDCIIIDLDRLPSQGRDVAMNLRKRKSARHIPLIFAGGDPGKVAGIKKHLPDAVYSDWEQIESAIKEAAVQATKSPIVPDSIMDAYAGKALVQKLGIKADSTLMLIDMPDDFDQTLGKLPDNVSVRKQARGNADLIIWAPGSQKNFSQRLIKISGLMNEKGSLWIAWPKKGSGIKSDLNQNVVRRIGLESGLVDYKICSIDKTFSALLFTRRKSKK